MQIGHRAWHFARGTAKQELLTAQKVKSAPPLSERRRKEKNNPRGGNAEFFGDWRSCVGGVHY